MMKVGQGFVAYEIASLRILQPGWIGDVIEHGSQLPLAFTQGDLRRLALSNIVINGEGAAYGPVGINLRRAGDQQLPALSPRRNDFNFVGGFFATPEQLVLLLCQGS